MIKEKLVASTIYLSLLCQLVTTVISLDGLNYDLAIEDNILKSHSITREVIKHKGAIISKEFMPKLN